MKKKISRENILLLSLIAVYFVCNLAFLTRFPFVHSDESWLAGHTRYMVEKGALAVTEPFFDLKPRHPHAIKSLFHLLQMPFIAIFGYSVFSVRLLSLLGGCACLLVFYKILRHQKVGASVSAISTLLLSLDIQFIYAAHFARQEILLCLAILLCILVISRSDGPYKNRTIALVAAVTGVSVGLHPNSFIVALVCGSILLSDLLFHKNIRPKQVGLYIGITAAISGVFVVGSLLMNRNFVADYISYGNSEFGVAAPLPSKIGELGYYFQKLWHGVSGTYYVPPLKISLVLIPLFGLLALISKKRRSSTVALASILGVLAGTVLIGRYNQTGFAFMVPLVWLLFAQIVVRIRGAYRYIISGILLAVVGVNSLFAVLPWLNTSYSNYISQIGFVIPADAKTIANLNTGFYFDSGALLDYRNLPYLKDSGMSFEEYAAAEGVEYIIVTDELDYIYSTRPKWNMIYGNLYYFWEDMTEFVNLHCTLVDTFSDGIYGVRIRELNDPEGDWKVKIFRVNSPTGNS